MSAQTLLQAALAHIPEGTDLYGEITAWLGQPTHVGDAVHLPLRPAYEDGWVSLPDTEPPKGLISYTKPYWYLDDETGEKATYTLDLYVFPEAGAPRYFQNSTPGFVVPINGLRYRVDIHLEAGDYGCEGGSVSFTCTDEPETEFLSWNHADAVAKERERLVNDLESYRGMLDGATEDSRTWHEQSIRSTENRIREIDDGNLKLRHPYYMQVFGQPNFIQGEVFPAHQGRCGMLLASIETDWGDSGNVNILFACDENGVPCKAWFEASCC